MFLNPTRISFDVLVLTTRGMAHDGEGAHFRSICFFFFPPEYYGGDRGHCFEAGSWDHHRLAKLRPLFGSVNMSDAKLIRPLSRPSRERKNPSFVGIGVRLTFGEFGQ